MKKVDVVVIGAGLVGLAVAYHLAKQGLEVVVAEREELPGMGATAYCTGGLRYQFSSRTNIELSKLSIPFYLSFQKNTGRDIFLRQHGYLFVTARPVTAEIFRENVRRENSLGVKSQLLTPAEAGKLFPNLETRDLLTATFCAEDGSADPSAVLQGFYSEAVKAGAEILLGWEARGFVIEGGEMRGVILEKANPDVDTAGQHDGLPSPTLALHEPEKIDPSEARPADQTRSEAKRNQRDPMVPAEGVLQATELAQARGDLIGRNRAGGTSLKRTSTLRKISSPRVVNCAGPWAAQVARLAGVDLPVYPTRRQVFVGAPLSEFGESTPLVVDLDTGWYLHREKSGSLLLGGTDRETPPGFDTRVDWDGFDSVAQAGLRRVPILEKVQIVRAYAGLREITPDFHAIIGESPEVRGFYQAVGFSGHGFMHAPAAGMIISDLITKGGTSRLDLGPLSPRRWQTAEMVGEKNIF
ncbi:MAG: FAD-binding oxidoreductase [Firmicutes bacterium]|nr:FAD-binding oxidoreductase [Bacillota bacterium]MCL5040730.1 FAD-binding oxidoreductase [Bacillota bacterium]